MKELFKDYLKFLDEKRKIFKRLESLIGKKFFFKDKNKVMKVKRLRDYYGFKVISFTQIDQRGVRKLFGDAIDVELSDIEFFTKYENKEIEEVEE